MAIGAPDHTRLSDDAFSHYRWTYTVTANIGIPSGIETPILDIDFIGVLGLLIFQVEYAPTTVMLYVDDILVDQITVDAWWEVNRGGYTNIDAFWGILQYNDIDGMYVFSWNPHFKCYVKKSFKITVKQWSGVVKDIKLTHFTYLEYR